MHARHLPVLSGPTTGNEVAYVCWGREILAPAAGKVVEARARHPRNNPAPDKYIPELLAKEPASPGNYVIIDHGNGEFSTLCHMQHESLKGCGPAMW